MRLNPDQFLPLLQPTVQLILEGYSNSRVSSYVYCGSVIIGEYGLYNEFVFLPDSLLLVVRISFIKSFRYSVKQHSLSYLPISLFTLRILTLSKISMICVVEL